MHRRTRNKTKRFVLEEKITKVKFKTLAIPREMDKAIFVSISCKAV
jgi:hypothetical protein